MKRFTTILAAAAVALLAAAPAMAHEEGSWILRAGVGMVAPESNNLNLGPGGTIEVDDGTSLVLTGTYMFTNNLAGSRLPRRTNCRRRSLRSITSCPMASSSPTSARA